MIFNNMFMIDLSNLNIDVTVMSRLDLMVLCFSIALLEAVPFIQKQINILEYVAAMALILRWALYIGFAGFFLFFRTSGAQFIYFQF